MDVLAMCFAALVAAALGLVAFVEATDRHVGPYWAPHKTEGQWVMRRRVSGQVETRRASDAEASKAQADDDYEWWATR